MSAAARPLLPAAIVAVLAAGCAPTPPSRLHVLPSAGGPAATDADGPVVFVDPADVATYADRTQLVTRTADGRVLLDGFDAWAEPPGAQVTAALVDGLAARFGADKVLATPASEGFAPDYKVAVDVLRLEADGAGNAVLDARWTLLAGSEERLVDTGRERFVEPIGGARDAPARMAALGRAVARLAGGLADRISRAAGPPAVAGAAARRSPEPPVRRPPDV